MTDKEMFLHLIDKLMAKVEDKDLSIYRQGYSINDTNIIVSDGQGNLDSCIIFYFDDQNNLTNYVIEEST